MLSGPLFTFSIFGQDVKIYMYSVMIAIGLVACLLLFRMLCKLTGLKSKSIDFYELLAIISIALGFLFAMIFQFFYAWAREGTVPKFGAMTFLGGLIGGVATFLVGTIFFAKPEYKKDYFTVMQIAVPVILIAHAFGRLGCWFGGCCFGAETHSDLGIMYNGVSRYPTQLYESVFLFIMCAVTILLHLSKKPVNAVVYLMGYGLFRFLLEFIRGDASRGENLFFGVMSPSQFWSILMIAGGIFFLVMMLLVKFKVKLPGILDALGRNILLYSCNERDMSTVKVKPSGAALVKAQPAIKPEAEEKPAEHGAETEQKEKKD